MTAFSIFSRAKSQWRPNATNHQRVEKYSWCGLGGQRPEPFRSKLKREWPRLVGENLQNSNSFFSDSAAMLTWNKMKYRLIPAFSVLIKAKECQKTPLWRVFSSWRSSAAVHGRDKWRWAVSGRASAGAECTDSKSKETRSLYACSNTFFGVKCQTHFHLRLWGKIGTG